MALLRGLNTYRLVLLLDLVPLLDYSFLRTMTTMAIMTYALNVEQWRTVFQLVLDNNTNCFEADLVLFDSMSKSLVKTAKTFDP